MASAGAGTVDVLTHVDFEGPAAIGDRAEAAGLQVRVHDLWNGAPVPVLAGIERLVVMGGPMGAQDDWDHPFLADERSLLAAATAAGAPVLGICLGAQLLASALGAEVRRGPDPEIGPGSVDLLADACDDALFRVVRGDRLAVMHWHGDTFDLPDGAVHLASSDSYPNQAFRCGSAYGLQFHVELRANDGDLVRAHLGRRHTVTDAQLAAIEPVGARIIDAFLALPTAPARLPT